MQIQSEKVNDILILRLKGTRLDSTDSIEFKEKSANMGEKMFFLIINNDIISKKEI